MHQVNLPECTTRASQNASSVLPRMHLEWASHESKLDSLDSFKSVCHFLALLTLGKSSLCYFKSSFPNLLNGDVYSASHGSLGIKVKGFPTCSHCNWPPLLPQCPLSTVFPNHTSKLRSFALGQNLPRDLSQVVTLETHQTTRLSAPNSC